LGTKEELQKSALPRSAGSGDEEKITVCYLQIDPFEGSLVWGIYL
jgi:hypothetical protein